MGSVQEAFDAEEVRFERVSVQDIQDLQGVRSIHLEGLVEGRVVTIQVAAVGQRSRRNTTRG